MKTIPTKPYGVISWLDKIKLVFALLPLPLVAVTHLFLHFSPFRRAKKSWKRDVIDNSFRYITSFLSVPQLQYMIGTTVDVYTQWAKKNEMEVLINEIGMDARLLWFGGERMSGGQRVVLYLHGGTYCLPMLDIAADFWKYAKETIERDTDTKVGFVALNYSLMPTAYFPTQLKQLIHALHYLKNTLGIPLEHIHIVGDSAGGALFLQLISHLLHPLEGVPPLETRSEGTATSRFGAACLMSPWVSITNDTGSYLENSDFDILSAWSWKYLGEQTLLPLSRAGVEYQTIRPYLEAVKAPEGWFVGIDKLVKRIMVIVGEKECLRDDVLEVVKKLHRETDEVVEGDAFLTTVVNENGVHNDHFFDFMAGQGGSGELTPRIIRWLEEGLVSE